MTHSSKILGDGHKKMLSSIFQKYLLFLPIPLFPLIVFCPFFTPHLRSKKKRLRCPPETIPLLVLTCRTTRPIQTVVLSAGVDAGTSPYSCPSPGWQNAQLHKTYYRDFYPVEKRSWHGMTCAPHSVSRVACGAVRGMGVVLHNVWFARAHPKAASLELCRLERCDVTLEIKYV